MAVQAFQVGIKALIRNNRDEILMVHIPEWGGNPAYWDLPGGRIDTGESFLDTLKRELLEEIGVSYEGTPTQLIALLTKITIPVGDIRLPFVLVVYEVKLPPGAEIKLDPESAEDEYKWFNPTKAADEVAFKFTSEFSELVRSL